jgi:hypothetical protein
MAYYHTILHAAFYFSSTGEANMALSPLGSLPEDQEPLIQPPVPLSINNPHYRSNAGMRPFMQSAFVAQWHSGRLQQTIAMDELTSHPLGDDPYQPPGAILKVNSA